MKRFPLPSFTSIPLCYTIEEGAKWTKWDKPMTAHSVIFSNGMRWDEHNGWNEESLSLDEVEYIKNQL